MKRALLIAVLVSGLLVSSAAAAATSYVGAGTIAQGPGGGSYTPGLPAGIAANDILVAVIADSSAACPAAPTGWTLQKNASNWCLFWRRATGSDTAPTFNENGFGIGVIIAVRGALSTAAPFDVVQADQGFFSAGTHTVPSITAASGAWVSILAVAGGSTATLSFSSTASPILAAQHNGAAGNTMAIDVQTASAPAAGGAVGSSTITNGGNGTEVHAAYFSLAADPGGGATAATPQRTLMGVGQ